MQPGVDLLVGGRKHGVLGGGIDGAVDPRIESVIVGQVASGPGGHHFKLHGLDFVQFGLGHALRRQFSRLGLQPGHHFKGVQDIPFGQLDRNRAAVGQQFYKALGSQHFEGLAQGGARHVEDFA